MKRSVVLIFLLLTVNLSAAQSLDKTLDECRALIAELLRQFAENCAETGVDQVCLSVGATFEQRPDAESTLDTDALNRVGAGGFDPAAGVYGLVMARFEDGMWLAFGDTSLTNLSTMPRGFLRLSAEIGQSGALVRAEPQDDGQVIGALYFGDSAALIGQSEDGAWLRVALDESRAGWINAETLRDPVPTGLLMFSADNALSPPFYPPMQAVNATFGPGLAPCDGLLTGGLLLQADEDSPLTMQINGLWVETTGTALMTQTDDFLFFDALEGDLLLGGEQSAEVGERLRVLINADGSTTMISGVVDYIWMTARTAPRELLPRAVDLPFNTVDLLTPFEPGTGFLMSMLPSDPCVIVWTASVNLRAGPGTDYPVQEAVLANLAASADARAQGTDGAMWWRITEGVWIRADNTTFGGDCGTLPFIEPPALPDGQSESSGE